jgi:hypothetical protein
MQEQEMAQQHEHVGMNKTGVQMSPFDTSAMLDEDDAPSRGTPGDESALVQMREAYIAESDGIGSIPMPGLIKAMVSMGIDMARGDKPQVLLDKLAERLAFERTGTRLYDALLTKLAAVQHDVHDGQQPAITHEQVAAIRSDEARHVLLVRDAIDAMGGDPTSQTPSADLAGVESLGLVQVLSDPRTSLAQSLHAILTAELADHAGWETLIALAAGHGQADMVTNFTRALQQETRHLAQVQSWYQQALGLGAAPRPAPDTTSELDAPPPGSTS